MAQRQILIVEDDTTLATVLKLAFESTGYAARIADDGAVAIRALATNCPDLVVLDLMLPHMDGFELLEAMRADEFTKDIPVIILSAKAEPDSVVRGWLRGIDSYFTKPFVMEELMLFVKRVFETLGDRESAA